MHSLAGKVALVTGVSRRIGIGAAIAQELARAGATIFTTYYHPYDIQMPWGGSQQEAQEIVEELHALGVEAYGYAADLAQADAPEQIFHTAQNTFGQIDILVNNATHDLPTTLFELEAASLDQHYAVNLRGVLLLCQMFAKQHNGQEGGRIINLTSGQNVTAMPKNIPYAATKGAIEGLTLSLSATLAPQRITVNAIDPGPTDTGWLSDDLQQTLTEQAPLGRIGTPNDAARLVCFLASDEARWITGQVIRSRGGF
ncbi:MAG: SDR family oxidoreductase [Chloroflexi bacterium AL-W]|nr:SDR family oxidoreductase [Chloroflexi bacterium AL-N1]NOK67418.1 SDR family oxidoreductase [Chloroflexi bacterium AL-N10]NOK75090.1 SDR family oxidoreductase [Chloroflexi bacterium AL-N5]NOK81877.1 SDR family oxidoreductase [Chloroflexi bacterium AL-W]NOK89723.1 SDR family oxidoreductase [Chloroflexi bacterium AL-N15]